jgi:HAD superfamily hydrolase (TIGR01450 family)
MAQPVRRSGGLAPRVIADDYDAFLLDLDGVLARGDHPSPHAGETVAALRGLGKRLSFVTNNSSRTPEAVVAHLASVGVEAEPSEVETSSLTTAAVLSERGIRSAAVIGEDGLRSALADAGITLVAMASHPAAVVVGWDRHVDYDSLRAASIAVQRGATLYASNDDASYPAPDGLTWPGAGAILAALEVGTGVRAEVFGKPHPPILRAALDRAGGGRPLVVGDRIETDIEGAANAGWDSALVLTGISTRADADAAPHRPTYVVDDLAGLLG